jgi:hypothetical protein
LRRLLANVERRRKRWGIVGGAPRQWVLEKAVGCDDVDSDLDIVVGMSKAELEQLIAHWMLEVRTVEPVPTALGGYRLRADELMVDLWSVKTTVGVAKGLVSDTKSFRAVARSAALSLDSIVVTSQGAVYEKGFYATIRTGVLRLNHCVVERPEKVAAKALALCERFRLVPDISLQAFIRSFEGSVALEALLDSHIFASQRREGFQLSSSIPKRVQAVLDSLRG